MKIMTKEEELRMADSDRQKMEEKFGKYGYDFSKNRIDIRGKELVVERDGCKMYMLPADDLRNFSAGYSSNTRSDLCYGHMRETSLLHMTSSPQSACVIIEDKKGQIQAASWVWVNEEKDLFVFDNINFHYVPDTMKYMGILRDYIEALPYQNVQIGLGFVEVRDLIPFGKECTEEECVPRPNNSHLRKDQPGCYCYSDYDTSKKVFPLPLFLKKDGVILEKEDDLER